MLKGVLTTTLAKLQMFSLTQVIYRDNLSLELYSQAMQTMLTQIYKTKKLLLLN